MTNQKDVLDRLLDFNGPTAMVITAKLKPVGDQDRFQPAGFPEIGHVTYDAPRNGGAEKVCIVDSPASMANHLEAVCLAGPNDFDLHADLEGLPYVVCVTDRNYSVANGKISPDSNDPRDKLVTTTFTEGHRIASDYFLDGSVGGKKFREVLRSEFGITEVKKDKTFFIHPEDWWRIYRTIFKYDPNSLVHGVMFAREQIKIPRFLSAHLEAYGAIKINRSGVKFDRLGKTVSGQPIFSVEDMAAREIRATFILDLAWLRSLGKDNKELGLNRPQKKLLLGLALWKIHRLVSNPWRYRTQCHLERIGDLNISCEGGANTPTLDGSKLFDFSITNLIKDCAFENPVVTQAYYPANELFKVGTEQGAQEKEQSSEDEED